MEVKCHTYLDEYKKYIWPTCFCTVPQIGQNVEILGRTNHSLKIVQITHCERPSRVGLENKPYLKIELR